ncbi:NAA60 [Lepeophtheirus salmonis]|uniref:N-alpha-acetyltransferase 60 n=1 Tax=Lepeophtheirus salmonis TaxID=72036 RepID=A0A7R8HE00_LEPSM|nr:NAA60 [Lepeophtheirus salmonis]CAF3033757.1 NAA60 [Lepeophtheirus salmonis]
MNSVFESLSLKIQSLFKEWGHIEYHHSWFREIETHRYYSVAAVKGDEILGILVLEIKEPSSLSKEDREILSTRFVKNKIGYILSLGVAENYRRVAFASFLLNNLMRSAHSDISEKGFYLHVLSTNFQPIPFYDKKRGSTSSLFVLLLCHQRETKRWIHICICHQWRPSPLDSL